MNLGAHYPEHFEDGEINFDLDRIYKQHIPHTHEKALDEIFLYGITYAIYYAIKGTGNRELRQEIEALRKEYDALQLKYDGLNAKFNLNQPTGEPTLEMRRELVRQAVGMGEVFKCASGEVT